MKTVDEWAAALPPEILKALCQRRSNQLKAAWHEADKALDHYYTRLGDSSTPTLEQQEEFRTLRAARQAAWNAYNNR